MGGSQHVCTFYTADDPFTSDKNSVNLGLVTYEFLRRAGFTMGFATHFSTSYRSAVKHRVKHGD